MRDPARTRETLLETALELIRHSNYDSIGVNELCSRAGVTKGAFYHHFESKADLYCAAAGHFWEQTKLALDALCSPSSPPLEQLENLIEFIIGRQCAEHAGGGPGACGENQAEVVGCPFFTCGVHVGTGEEKFRRAMMEMADNGVRYYLALVRGLKAEGALRGDPDTDQVARLLFQYMHGLFIYGRVWNSIAAIETDLREGFYRILDLKPEYRRKPAGQPLAAYA